jgi:hypothetical protein
VGYYFYLMMETEEVCKTLSVYNQNKMVDSVKLITHHHHKPSDSTVKELLPHNFNMEKINHWTASKKPLLQFTTTYLCLVFTPFTLKGVIAEVSYCYQATEIAHMDSVRVGHFKQPLPQELGCTMCYLTVPFHLTETQATIPFKKYMH